MMFHTSRYFFAIILMISTASCRTSSNDSSTVSSSASKSSSASNKQRIDIDGTNASKLFTALEDAGADFNQQGPGASVVSSGTIQCSTTFVVKVIHRCSMATSKSLVTGGLTEFKGDTAKALYSALLDAGVKETRNGPENGSISVVGTSCTATFLGGMNYNCSISIK